MELKEPRFHDAIWNAIAVLERSCRTATEIEKVKSQSKLHFESLDIVQTIGLKFVGDG